MSNVFALLKRDFKRLLLAPAALVVVFVLIVLPSLYTWFNVAGFWDPYSNTGNMRVCVVNEDQGSYSDMTGSLNMGDQVVEELSHNTQLGWEFTDRDTALEKVRSGAAYAAFIIPCDFSSNTLTLLTGDFHQPTLQYYVNEKSGGVSTKVTDSGATSLDQTINDTFVSVVSETLASSFDEKLKAIESDLDQAQSGVVEQLNQVSSSLDGAQKSITALQDSASTASKKAQDAKGLLQQAKDASSSLQSELETSSELLSSTQNSLGPFMVSFMSVLDESSVLASQTITQANDSVGTVSAAVSGAEGTLTSTVEQGKALISLNETLIESLNSIAQSLPDGEEKDALNQAIATLQTQNDSLSSAIDGAQTSYESINAASSDIATASEGLSGALQTTLDAASEYRDVLSNETFPALNSTTTSLANTTNDLARALDKQNGLIDKGMAEIDQLTSALSETSSTLSDTAQLLGGFSSDLGTLSTDVAALQSSGVLEQLFGDDGIDPAKVSEFMFSPAKIETVSLYSVNSYGAAMAPLFMNLTLWIGVFMLLVILRQEVDREGLSNLTARQSYIGRLIFLAILASLQAIVCCSGNLILGVQVASVALFYITSILASLTYLCIQYALSVLLQHVGKGLCIILIFVQIPGATGLYPIEMTPDFFQVVYPLFPFTYGINALRETIAGFYGLQWVGYLGIMLLFLVAFLAIGLFLRPYFVNLNRMVAHQIKESDIINGEEAELPARRYRTTLLLRSLINQKEYRQEILNRYNEYKRRYEKGKRYAIALAIVIPISATVIMAFLSVEKVMILTTWLVWLVLVIMFSIIVEFVRDRLDHEVALSGYSNETIRGFYSEVDSKAPSLFDEHEATDTSQLTDANQSADTNQTPSSSQGGDK